MRAAEVIRPGLRETDATAEILAALVRGAKGKPGTLIENPLLVLLTAHRNKPHYVE